MGDEEAGREQVGSVAEEAAKLLEALQGWGAQAGAHAGAAGEHGEHGEHMATGSAECAYCPVCRAIALVRQTSPEVRQHLSEAASSLLQAGAAFLEARAARPEAAPEQSSGVERIDLDEGAEGWDAD